jgi:hypothetical protein
MARRHRRPLDERVREAAEAALGASQYVSPVDVFLGIGWLDGTTLKRWQLGQVECLEAALQVPAGRVAEAMELLRSWAKGRQLLPSETQYVARTPQRQTLRFSVDANPAVEELYRTHWISPELPEKKRERLAEKQSQPPELVVIQPLDREWKCHRCGGGGNLLMMETPGPACLKCVGLGDLEFLAAGNALLTRRAKAKSTRYAVVVRFSRSRKRYERQGLLVEPRALADAEREVGVQAP